MKRTARSTLMRAGLLALLGVLGLAPVQAAITVPLYNPDYPATNAVSWCIDGTTGLLSPCTSGGGGGGGGAITAASGAYASGSIASGAYASGAFASGAFASGSIGSGAITDLGAIADAMVAAGATGSVSAKMRRLTADIGGILTAIGAIADTACGTDTDNCSNNAMLKRIAQNVTVTNGKFTDDGSNNLLVSMGTGLNATDDMVTVVGKTTTVAVTPTITSGSAYSTGNDIGGKLTLTSAIRVSGGTGVIQNLTLSEKGTQKSAIDVVFFTADPTNTTFTDKSALTVNNTDLLTIIGSVSIATSDYISFATNAVATKTALGIAFKGTNANLYACMVSRGTPTYAGTTDLTLTVGVLQD